ncbi:acylneuraminate cytidylyltransferase family protein [Pedobacter sp. P351]|uniref:acylneuraminate cytidylyltransferase family protein n=1 Tax=Pedobacter superstes TaxID=3133441 RepID=UPI003094D159
MRVLYVIPARKGSKGLPGKNIKLLNNKPLISYSIDFALQNMDLDAEICITTNDDDVIAIAKQRGIEIPFKRPEHLASDIANTYDVLLHALNYYKGNGKEFEAVMLLQPTSPFRNSSDHKAVIDTFDLECDMVVTVKESKENPYFTIFEENEFGYLEKSKRGEFQRRQDCPQVYTYNGSIYLIRVSSLEVAPLSTFKKVKKVLMPENRSIDIDTMADWVLAEYFSNAYN